MYSHPSLKKVIIDDEELLLKWANDPVVRKGSFNHNTISKVEHHSWFINKLEDPDVLMWIFELNNNPSGLVRFEKNNKGEAVISYQLVKFARGKKLASKMLKLAIEEIEKSWGDIKILAFTLPENLASIKSLENVGFCLIRSIDRKNLYEYKSH